MSHDRSLRSIVFLLVCALHAWIGWELVHFHPAPRVAQLYRHAPTVGSGTVLVLTFDTRTDSRPEVTALRAEPVVGPLPGRADQPSVASSASGPAKAVPVPESAGGGAPLDLSISLGAQPAVAARDMLEHRTHLEFQSTRFDAAWLSEGTVVDSLAKRSMIAGIFLGAMGALVKPCTELRRSHYDRGCVTDQYQHSADVSK